MRRHYENGYSNIGEFIEAHDDRLPPELIEEARAAAHAAGLPFSEKAYRGGEEPDPYLFDGSMSMEDYELMHRMIEKERSERMEETILSGYLSNLGKYTEGRPAGEWVSFPTTAEHLKEVFDRIGIDGKNYGELHITEYQSSIPGLAGKLTELESLDELNYLGELLKMQFDDDREKFAAAITYGDHTRDLQDIINLAQNLDCYWIYPSVKTEEDYGHYLIEELDELELPEEAKNYFLYEERARLSLIRQEQLRRGYLKSAEFMEQIVHPAAVRLSPDIRYIRKRKNSCWSMRHWQSVTAHIRSVSACRKPMVRNWMWTGSQMYRKSVDMV